MSRTDAKLDELARLAGILPGYHDQGRKLVEASPEARASLLEGLGFDIATRAGVDEGLARLRRLRAAPLPRTIVAHAGEALRIRLRTGTKGTNDKWRLILEDGTETGGAAQDGIIEAGVLPTGYHRLELAGAESHALVVSAPRRCWQPQQLAGDARGWGLTAQVYGLRGQEPWCIGTYTDVAELAAAAGRKSASFLGLSPVHALFSADPGKYSPYSPSSRLFLQTGLLDPRRFEGATGEAVRGALGEADIAAEIDRCSKANLVDYHATAALLSRIFERAWQHVRHRADASLDSFREAGGEDLEAHALFEALSGHFREQGLLWSGAWPAAFRDRASPDVARFREQNKDRIAFHIWLQHMADVQLGAAAEAAQQAGMEIGLYRDLAVGADRAGSEVWSAPLRYALALSIGAPPDPLGPQGQDWGLPPIDPIRLEADDLIAFRHLVAANMRHAGAIRIDHAFQMQRLFLAPVGAGARHGGYVEYPFEALLAVLRVESHRAKCMVIAEDLGTAPEGFSDRIMESGLLSYRLLTFERDKKGEFLRPAAYPRDAMAAITTHDLPTLPGFWKGLDIDLRECFGVFDRALAEHEQTARAADRARLRRALDEEGLAPESEDTVPQQGVIRYLARAHSCLVALQVEDVIGELQQANLPGLAEGPPNWRRRYSMTVPEVAAADGVLGRAAALVNLERRSLHAGGRLASDPPRATYRLQLNAGFTFEHARAIVPYLAELGISHIYLSPIQAAEPGSAHGYDVVDHSRINPELGGRAAFERFSDAARASGLFVIVDIVPNHMGIAGSHNPWWRSVLTHGRNSPHAGAFDIQWSRHDDKLLLPVLGQPLHEAVRQGELQIGFEAQAGLFHLVYFDRKFPLRPATQASLIERSGCMGREPRLAAAVARFRAAEEAPKVHEEAAGLVATACAQSSRLAGELAGFAQGLGQASTEHARALDIEDVLASQHYQLAFWRMASSEINYRRFFDISTLAGLRIEDPEVLEASHALVFDLISQKRVHGLRIDHVDGLADPAAYLARLQERVGPGFYVVVEKILEAGEDLPNWPIAGTTGYEVLNELDDVFVAEENGSFFDECYRQATGDNASYEDQLFEAKFEMLERSFVAEASALEQLGAELRKRFAIAHDLPGSSLRKALHTLLAVWPVYRTYVTDEELSPADRAVIEKACIAARHRTGTWERAAISFIAMLLDPVRAPEPRAALFRRKFQQLSGPLMAKGLEDTLFYRYSRFVALNEVGGDPGRFGISVKSFHGACMKRSRHWPHMLVPTATHDTKRGEDARARLLALSWSPGLWQGLFELWSGALGRMPGAKLPDARDRYFMFQSLVAHWPNDHQTGDFRERWLDFIRKALREAKVATSWTEPDEEYEARAEHMIDRLLRDRDFLQQLSRSMPEICEAGRRVSHARLVLKFSVPGVPDTYRGTEFEDLSFVDPDNRRAVDFEGRRNALHASTMNTGPDSSKLQLLRKLLQARAELPDLFAYGSYEPFAEGQADLIAFQRIWKDETVAVVVSRNPVSIAQPKRRFRLPEGTWRNLLTAETFNEGQALDLPDLFGAWPAALLRKTDGLGRSEAEARPQP